MKYMQFLDPKDFDLLQKLFNSQTITMSQFQKWEKPEEGSLIEIVKSHHHTISEGLWVKHLIKDLKIARFNRPQIDPSIYSELNIDPESIISIIKSSIYPLCITNNNLWVGILRSDSKLDTIPEIFPEFSDLFFCALSPSDANALDSALLKYGRQVLKWMLPPGTIR
jgi:hypothetical protein